MIPLELIGVRVDAASNTPIVLLRDADGERLLPILIGSTEAAAIHSAMSGMVPPRPLTHDLLIVVLDALGATLERIEITKIEEHTFHAALVLSTAGGQRIVSCRPSDAIALAVRRRAVPILGDPEVLLSAGVPDEQTNVEHQDQVKGDGGDDAEILDQFRDFLDDVNPEDFES